MAQDDFFNDKRDRAMKPNKIKGVQLGNKVEDVVTGLQGIASSKVEYLNGCVQFGVKPRVGEDGKMPDAVYIDVQQLIYLGEGVLIEQVDPGGEMPDVPKR